MKFFSASNKKSPIQYKGDRTVVSLLEFVHTNASTKFDITTKKQEAAVLVSLQNIKKTVRKAINEVNEFFKKLGSELTEADKEGLTKYKKSLEDELDKGTNITEEAVSALISEFNKSELLQRIHKLESKNVIKVASHEEYLDHIKKASEANKLVVVDFFATWCGPCVAISPLFAKFSVEYPNIVFLKVDVDKLSETSSSVGIKAMPTFKFYKGGEIVNSIQGAVGESVFREAFAKYQ